MMYRWAQAMATEFKQKGANVALAPGIGIARVPTAGRNFEYICGEDPTLGSVLTRSVVTGIQDTGVIANAKHWVNNEIEDERRHVSANVDERVRFELYYAPFQAAIDAGVLSVMCAYNRVNDLYACENNETLSHLKDAMGFEGWLMSDWLATKSTVDSLLSGLDQEMPLGLHYSESRLEGALQNGDVDMQQVDRSVTRILTAMYQIGLFDQPQDQQQQGDPLANVTSDAHNQLARELAAVSTVLLKNTGALLPLSREGLGECVAVFGDQDTVSGGGSGHVTPAYVITPAQGIALALAGTSTAVLYDSGSDLNAARELAAKCGVAVVVVATSSAEGSDRASLSLGGNQDELVAAVAAANPRTIVSVRAPGAVLLPWAAGEEEEGASVAVAVAAVLLSGLPGQEAGNALADVLFGAVNPSARLPVTLPRRENEVGFSRAQYPGVGQPPEASYLEGLLIGYRWYDAHQVTPLFPFGHGLSYTSFSYQTLVVTPTARSASASVGVAAGAAAELGAVLASISFTVQNTGSRAGAEVAQLYLAFPAGLGEPVKQLRAFSKLTLAPAEQGTVQWALTVRDVSTWDAALHAWVQPGGLFSLLIGASSADIRLEASIQL